jgi:hypothetical protein
MESGHEEGEMRQVMSRARAIFSAGLLALVVAGCGGTNTAEAGINPDNATVLKVENNGFSDMRIYVYQGGQRVRLGTANGHQTSTFKLNKTLVPGITSLRFEAVPIGAQGSSGSEPITVTPGESITLRIQP